MSRNNSKLLKDTEEDEPEDRSRYDPFFVTKADYDAAFKHIPQDRHGKSVQETMAACAEPVKKAIDKAVKGEGWKAVHFIASDENKHLYAVQVACWTDVQPCNGTGA